MVRSYMIGVDLGGTKTEVILLDGSGAELFRERAPTNRDAGYDAVLQLVHRLIAQAAARLAGAPYTVGVGIPGFFDEKSGSVLNANTTCLIGRPLKSDLEGLLGHPVAMENDANCFVLAEARAGAARGHGLVFGIIMGTGCGGGLYINGSVRRGPHSLTGEWGHMSIDPNGHLCYCGKKGCIETMISGAGIEATYQRRFGTFKTGPEIVAGARAGDADCNLVFSQFLDDYGRALGGVISLLDPDMVVLGGGLSSIDELYTLGRERVAYYAFHPHIQTPILRNQLGDSAGVIGAAWLGADYHH